MAHWAAAVSEQLRLDGLADAAHARRGDPWTSHAAADSIAADKLRLSQRAVLECFRLHGPMHHNQLWELYERERNRYLWPKQSISGLRTRTSELVDAGQLEDSGAIVVLESNRKSIVWRIP